MYAVPHAIDVSRSILGRVDDLSGLLGLGLGAVAFWLVDGILRGFL